MQEIDLKAILYLLLSRIKWIILSLVLGALLLGTYSYFFIQPQYTSSALIYVRNMTAGVDPQSATTSNLSASERLAYTFQRVVTTGPVLDKAVTRLDGQVTVNQLKGMLSLSLVKDTALINLEATGPDKALAKRACQAVAEASTEAFSLIDEAGSVTIAESAKNATKTSPNVKRNTLIGGLIGLVLSVAIILIISLLDNTVHDKEDLQQHLNIPVLGEIPSFGTVGKGGKHNEK